MPLTIEQIKSSGRVGQILADGSYRLHPHLELVCLEGGFYPRGIGAAFKAGDTVQADSFHDVDGKYPEHVSLINWGFNWPIGLFELRA